MAKDLKCKLMTIYLTLRYPFDGLFRGLYLSGHDYKDTGEVCGDMWHIKCSRCGQLAHSEVKPYA